MTVLELCTVNPIPPMNSDKRTFDFRDQARKKQIAMCVYARVGMGASLSLMTLPTSDQLAGVIMPELSLMTS